MANHDKSRPRTRFDHDGLGARRARAILVMLYALRGTPFIYQGEELGLPDARIPPDRVVDVDGRDPERAPIPWTRGAGHGFTTGDPWLPFVDDADELSAEAQDEDPDSTLNLTRALARLRDETPALVLGDQAPVDAGEGVLAWTRAGELFVAVNFTAEPKPLDVRGELVLSSDPTREAASSELGPSEAVILRIG